MAVEGLRQALSERYTIERELGRGGMATVYLATDEKVGRRVAIKVLLPELAAALGGERFHREIKIASQLSHPNILPVYDSGEAEGTLYYVMPFVEGESLRDRLERERQLPIEDAIRITCQIAMSLEYAHAQGIIHRDIKPENILLEAGQAVLADFGIARAVTGAADAEALTRTGMSLGTPAYMSPEQAMGERTLDGRSDQYALACVTYEMLAGQPPFTAPTMQGLIARHIAEQVPLITTVRPAVPDEVQDVILQALEKVPADRFATMTDFARALSDAAAMTMTLTSRRATATSRAMRYTTRTNRVAPPPSVARWSRKRQLAGAVAGVVLLAMSATAAVWAWPELPPTSVADGGIARRVAVLYFDDETATNELGYLADGLTNALIEQLSQVSQLDVVSQGGVTPFRGTSLPADSIARALDVGTLVQGSIDKRGDRVRLTVRLVEGSSGADFKRRTFDLPGSDLLAVRDSLAQSVAVFLRQRLGDEIRLRSLKQATRDVEAWALVQRAEKARADAEAALQSSTPDIVAARLAGVDSLLVRAQARDAKWAEPVVLRGNVALRRARLEREPQRVGQWVDSALALANAALQLAPRDAGALELRGTARFMRIQRSLVRDQAEVTTVVAEAEQDLQAATAVDPARATAYNVLSALYYYKLNKASSYLQAQKAYEADAYLAAAPGIVWRLFATSYDMEEYPNATQWCAEGRKRFPTDPQFARCRLLLYTMAPQPPDPGAAWSLVDTLAAVAPKHEWEYRRREAQLLVAATLARAGLRDSALRVIERARATREIDPRGELMGFEAFARTFLGQRDEPIDLLLRFMTDHPEHRAGWGKVNNWWWRDLQGHPRYRELSNLPK